MGTRRFARSRPNALAAATDDLRRAAEYQIGRPLSDSDLRRWLDAEWDALVKGHVRLGRWLADLHEADAAGVPPTPYALWRARLSAALRVRWARKRGEAQVSHGGG